MINSTAMTRPTTSGSAYPDPLGVGTLIPSARAALKAQFPDAATFLTLNLKPGKELIPFQWDGIRWSPGIVLTHWGYALVAIGLVLAGSLFFERFDPARRRPVIKRERAKSEAVETAPEPVAGEPATSAPARLTRLAGGRDGLAFGTIFLAEAKLLLKGWPWWWYLVAGGLILACVFSPLEVVRMGLLPAAWVWPILVWSGLGCRERRFDTDQLVFSAARPLRTQLPATWLAAVGITAVTGLGAAFAFLFTGNMPALASWGASVLFIPSLALAMGVWSGSNRLFEIVYFLWWYGGAVQKVPALDFTSAPAPTYLLVSAVLLGAAVLGRRVQLRK